MVSDEPKTEEEVKIEEGIIEEMRDIVAKRDSLVALLEQDRLRCFSKRSTSHLRATSSGIYHEKCHFRILTLTALFVFCLVFVSVVEVFLW